MTTTITGILEAKSMMFVSVVTGSEARPATTARVLWIGGNTRPTFMAEGDVWFMVQSTGPTAPEFVTTSLNTITQSVPFSQILVLNGTPPFTFTVVTGVLPAGLTIHSTTGVISGTPTASASYSFSVQVSNAVGSATRTFTGTVTSSAVAPLITTTALNSLTQSTSFSQTLQATGTSPLTWTVSGGTIPSGLTLNSANGTITGAPTGSGSYSFTVQATNTAGNDTQLYTGTISASGVAPTITTTTLTSMQVSLSFSQTLNKTGSTPMTWGISAGTIPPGLSLNSSTGVISGVPTTAASYSFTVSATNTFGSDTQAYTGTVSAAPDGTVYSIFGTSSASLTSYSDGEVGAWLSHQFYQWSGATALPAGSKIAGARLYVPAGSAHIGVIWYGAVIRNLSGFYSTTIDVPYTEFDSNGSKKSGGLMVEGWNEVYFDTEVDVSPQGGAWVIGVQLGDGTRYLHNTTYTSSSVRNPENKNFFLSELIGPPFRSFYKEEAVLTARWYGIDTLVRIPS